MATAWHSRAEAGDKWGLQLVEWVARRCGRRIAHWFVAPVALYFLLRRTAERKASRAFLSRALGRAATFGDCLRHFYTFACTSVDRIFLLLDGSGGVPMRVYGRHLLESRFHSERGCILLGAHLGSFEACRQAGIDHSTRRLRILLDRAVNLRLVQRMERIAPEFAEHIIDAADNPLAVTLRIGESLRAGDWIGWMGDRYREGERTTRVDFLGLPAALPTSPFLIAHLFKVPVFLVLAFYEKGAYEVIVEPLVDETALETTDRDRFIQQHVQIFSDRLTHYARRSPFNWFNFYDVWQA